MKSKRIIAVCMAILLITVIAVPAIAQDNQPARMRLTYNQPAYRTAKNGGATVWEATTLPIGNGKIGANIYGEPNDDLITINEETLWGGGRGSVPNYDGGNPNGNARDVYDSLANHYVNGTSTRYDMEDLRGDPRGSSGYDDGYLPMGNLDIRGIGHDGYSNYERALDLDNGIATVNYNFDNTAFSREFFVSNPDNVFAAHYDANRGGRIGFTVSMSIAGSLNAQSYSSVSNNIGYITYKGTVKNNGLMYNTQIAVIAENGSLSASGGSITVRNADSVTIYLTTATDYENRFYDDNNSTAYYYRTGESADALNARVNEVLMNAVNKGYDGADGVKQGHINDYKKLYDRVKLDIGQTEPNIPTDTLLNKYKNNSATGEEQRYMEVLMYQYGRYLLIAGSRENSQIPTTLQGIWNDIARTDWNSDIHTNINLQMNYWLSNNCNLTECALPLVDYMSKLEIPGGITVEKYTGSKNGIMAHTQNTPFGYTAPGWDISTWGWSPAAATWLMQNCYDYYQFSQDEATLRKTIYPMLKEQVLMYEDLLMMKDGRKVMPIALSPEIGPVTSGNTFEQSIIYQLYKDTIEAAKILGEDNDLLSGWTETMNLLKPIEIGNSGQVKEWYSETSINSVRDTSGHRHLSNLLGLYPGDIFDTPEKIAAAKVSLNNKNFGAVGKGGNPDGGWTYGQMSNTWARVGEGENAYYCLSQLIKNRLYPNLWDYHQPNAFQIDANYGYSAGLAEMLVQSHLGYIEFLPALTNNWADGKVEGLLAEGNFEVGIEWKDSQVKKATIKAKKNSECSFKNPFGYKDIKVFDSKGNKVDVTSKNGIYTFNAKANETYQIKTVPELNLRATRDESGKVTLTWDAQPGVEYKIYRNDVYFN